MKIAILKNPMKSGELIYPNQRNWTKDLKTPFGIDKAVFYYIKHKYPKVKCYYKDIDSVLEKNDFDLVYTGTEYYHEMTIMGYKSMKIAKKEMIKLRRVKNLVPEYKYLNYMMDKCGYLKLFEKKGIPVAPTKCYTLSKYNSKMKLNMKKFVKVHKNSFLKPIPGGFSKNTFSTTKNNNLNNYLNSMKNKNYNQLMIQKHMNFATKNNPEIKCYFVGNKHSYSVKTTYDGDTIGVYSELPKKIELLCNKVINVIQTTTRHLVVTRIDVFKNNGKYYVNEIEVMPWIASEDLVLIKDWNYDKHQGDQLMNILKQKYSSLKIKI